MPTTRHNHTTADASSPRPRWTQFERAQQVPNETTGEVSQVWQNSLYTVIMSVNLEHSMAKLSIRRNDREAVHDWRDLQRIKNELVGPECEGFELYPAESRLVDTANQFFLWIFLDQTFRISVGFHQRLVAHSAGRHTKARQRPFQPDERPPDALSGEQMDFLAEHGKGTLT
jgi:hypothetical protein